MAMVDEVLIRALELTESERAAIAHQLLLSLETDDFDEDAESAWLSEIESRLSTIETGNYKAEDWREAIDRIRNSLSPRRTS